MNNAKKTMVARFLTILKDINTNTFASLIRIRHFSVAPRQKYALNISENFLAKKNVAASSACIILNLNADIIMSIF